MFLLCCEVDLMGKKRSSFVLYINSFAMQTPPISQFYLFYISATTNNFCNKNYIYDLLCSFQSSLQCSRKNLKFFTVVFNYQSNLKQYFLGVFVEAIVK